MKSNLWFLIIAIVVFLGIFFYFKSNTTQTSTKLTTSSSNEFKELKASFLVVTNNTIRIFTDSKYHNQSKRVYIEKDNPKVIHIFKDGITWGDFFETLPMEITKDCLITGSGQRFCSGDDVELAFYLNGIKKDDLLDLDIKNNDKLLILFGNYTELQIQSYFNQL